MDTKKSISNPGTRAASLARGLAAAMAAMVLIQSATAGRHLTGDAGALGLHRWVGTEVLTILSVVIAVTAAVASRTRPATLAGAIVGFFLVGLQIGMGFADQLDIHVPLGIAIFGLYLTMALVPTTKGTE